MGSTQGIWSLKSNYNVVNPQNVGSFNKYIPIIIPPIPVCFAVLVTYHAQNSSNGRASDERPSDKRPTVNILRNIIWGYKTGTPDLLSGEVPIPTIQTCGTLSRQMSFFGQERWSSARCLSFPSFFLLLKRCWSSICICTQIARNVKRWPGAINFHLNFITRFTFPPSIPDYRTITILLRVFS